MDWLWLNILGFAIIGAGVTWRKGRTGRGRTMDDHRTIGPQTRADRDAIRAAGSMIQSVPSRNHQ